MKVGYLRLDGFRSTAYLDSYEDESGRIAADLPFEGEDRYSGNRITVLATDEGWVEIASP